MRRFREFIALIAIAYTVILLYISLEFIFLLSKVDYFIRLTLGEYAKLFLNSSLLLLVPIALFLSFIYLIYIGFSRQGKMINLIKQLFLFLFSFSFIFFIFSHLDTFIYTSFNRMSISYSPLPIRILISCCLLALTFVFSKTYLPSIFEFFYSKTKILVSIFSVVFIFAVVFLYQNLKHYSSLDIKINNQSNQELPNIILFSSDGLETERMSVYGADRDTTPNLRELAKSAVVFTQAYCNVQNTRGSIVSILTGKAPATTKVFGAGEILKGKDSFEHLPAILKKLGYYCASFGFYDTQSPVVTNMLDSFDELNGAKTYLSPGNFLLNKLIKTYPLEIYFLHNLFLERIYYKLACLCGKINKFPIEFFYRIQDREIIDRANRIIKQINKPIFIQIHLGANHRSVFWNLRKQPKKFSSGKDCTEDDNDCYDDALVFSDELFKDVLNTLRQSDKYNQTIIFFLTDHNRHGSFGHLTTPVPLIIRFPNISDIHNCDYPVQYLDIAPSILKAINVNIPDWMEGMPILYPMHNFTKEQIVNRPIFTFVTRYIYNKKQKKWLRVEVGPPLYGIQEVGMVIDRYLLKLALPSFDSQLFILENFKHILIDNENKRKEYLSILLGYLKNKGFIFKR